MLTDERILELWREHGGVMGSATDFARAVEAEARRDVLEAAAKTCDVEARSLDNEYNRTHHMGRCCMETANDLAAAIRALKEEEPSC